MFADRMTRIGLTGLTLILTSACAHGSGADLVPASTWGPVAGPMCDVRVESGYDEPVEAGAMAGARQLQLGEIEPERAREFSVPCAHGAVTVFRIVRNGPAGEARLGARSRALHADEVTVLTLRPAVSGYSPVSRH